VLGNSYKEKEFEIPALQIDNLKFANLRILIYEHVYINDIDLGITEFRIANFKQPSVDGFFSNNFFSRLYG
jgi:hypothetical protein